MKISLDSVLKYEQPTKYIVKSENYSNDYNIPVLTAGKSFILGYTNETQGIYNASKKPVIIFDDFTTESKFVDFDFKVKSSAMKILDKINKNDNLKYFYYAMKKILYKPFSHKRTWISEYSKLLIKNRNSEEQNQIVAELDNISNMISLKRDSLNALNELVKSRFIEMFGGRFADENSRCHIEDLASTTIGLTYKPANISENGIIVLRSGNIQNADLFLEKDIVRVDGIKIPESKYVKENDILMCSRNGSARLVGKCCLIPRLDEAMSYGAFMTVIRSNFPYFLNGFFNSTFFTQQLTGTQTASVNQITTGMLNKYNVITPTVEEEKAFANFVKLIDKSKFIVQKQIKDLQELLDSKMDEYFG